VVDFGLRRIHGFEAGLKAARAFHIAGVHATSNVAAGQAYGLELSGTMAHSYVQAHEDEYDAFRAFAQLYGDTVLLVDTYDTIAAVRKIVTLAKEMGPAFRVSGIRLDSGDLVELSFAARRVLDEAGLQRVTIFASGSLNEDEVARIVAAGAPVDGFGVGTDMGVSRDAPSLEIIYKLVEYAGQGRLKLSPGKAILPGRKQIFRVERDGQADYDILARHGAQEGGRALLLPVMKGGRRLAPRTPLDDVRAYARTELDRLPAALRALDPAAEPYLVKVSESLARVRTELRRALEA
jgi:nicotinate phosphoribosyltransferase